MAKKKKTTKKTKKTSKKTVAKKRGRPPKEKTAEKTVAKKRGRPAKKVSEKKATKKTAKQAVAAKLVVYKPAEMNKRGVNAIVKWLDQQKTFLLENYKDMAKDFRANYLHD